MHSLHIYTCSTCRGGGGGDDRDQFKVDVFEDPEVRSPQIYTCSTFSGCGGGVGGEVNFA